MGGNKPHKSRFASKGEQTKKTKGRVHLLKGPARGGVKLSAAGNASGHKLRMLESSQAKREQKRKKVLEERRIGTAHGPPKIVAFVGLSATVDPSNLTREVFKKGQCPSEDVQMDSGSWTHHTTCLFPEYQKARFSLLSTSGNLDRQLDAAKVADVIVLVIRAAHEELISQVTGRSKRYAAAAAAAAESGAMDDDEDLDDAKSQFTMTSEVPDVNQYGMCVDHIGQKFLSIVQAFGLPSVAIAVVGMNEIPSPKLQRQMLRLHTVYFRHFFPEKPKVFVCDSDVGVTELVRHMAVMKTRAIQWREQVPYMVAEHVEWEQPEGDAPPRLAVSGYLRGRPISANTLVHISHIGTFQLHSIRGAADPCPVSRQQVPNGALHVADPDAEPLTWIKDVDPMANEQTWPTEEELGEAPDEQPFSDSDDEGTASHANDDAVSTKSRKSIYTEIQTQIDSLMATDISRLEKLTPEQREAERQHFAEQRKAALGEAGEDREFPDEVDAPFHVPARHRFLRYRGLASFRTSKWDPFENLPLDYGRIYQFHNIRATQKRAWAMFNDMPVKPDAFVTLVLKGVPQEPFNSAVSALRLANGFLTLSGLRRHEHKWSVMHYSLQFNSKHTQPIKSKESVLMHVGFRIMRCNPIFSEPSMKADKHKMMRFFHPDDRFAVASVFAPISYPPMPVLVFKTPELDAPTADLVAWGSVMGADPNRIILKKVVLTGNAYKVHKKQAVVRFMFHNEKDVNWFKPVELYTKLGQAGRIMQPLGTHGYMKCQMSGVLRGEDTVCMALYKRVYPKWTTVPCSWLPGVEQQYRVPSLEDHGPKSEDLDMTPDASAVA